MGDGAGQRPPLTRQGADGEDRAPRGSHGVVADDFHELDDLVARLSRDARHLARVRDAAALSARRGALAEAQRRLAIALSRCGDPAVPLARVAIAAEVRALEGGQAREDEREIEAYRAFKPQLREVPLP